MGGSPVFFPSILFGRVLGQRKRFFFGETWQDPQVELKILEEFGLISRLVSFLLGVG